MLEAYIECKKLFKFDFFLPDVGPLSIILFLFYLLYFTFVLIPAGMFIVAFWIYMGVHAAYLAYSGKNWMPAFFPEEEAKRNNDIKVKEEAALKEKINAAYANSSSP